MDKFLRERKPEFKSLVKIDPPVTETTRQRRSDGREIAEDKILVNARHYWTAKRRHEVEVEGNERRGLLAKRLKVEWRLRRTRFVLSACLLAFMSLTY